MHELALARGLLAAVERNLTPADTRVVRVRVLAGSASGVVPDALRFAFRVLAEGTRAERAEVAIRTVAARGLCRHCRKAFEFHGLLGNCPRCGRLGGELLSGDHLMLEAIEVADV
jgi:hydrogenase nickel incorporation protein HypA/HybF